MHDALRSKQLRQWPSSIQIVPDWAPLSQVLIGWPCRPDNWQNGGVPAQKAILNLARAISPFTPVTILAPPGPNAIRATADVHAMEDSNVRVESMIMDDCWIRDTGPVWSVDSEKKCVIGVDFGFNAWGGHCYQEYYNDRLVTTNIVKFCKYPQSSDSRDVVVEGGAISGDGEGTLLAVEECLLCNDRNSNMTKDRMEDVLKRAIGVTKVIWLRQGVIADTDTGGHVDNFCVFIRPGVVILHWRSDLSSPQHKASSQAMKILQQSTDARGRPLQVIRIEAPKTQKRSREEASCVERCQGTKERQSGDILPRSYVNLLIVNKGVIVPSFGDEQADGNARSTLEAAFGPTYQVAMVPAHEFVLGGGGIHCITLGVPKAPFPEQVRS
eukprot:Plantae.Rhodophyta-Hildenbrandia_rubra.ctg11688.p1 GENE.Plantae.Rhodophyta-Hildenbrandia_rubra.ctg11688~~Plantae.Rhodophyta-Hildenbrandia_rubra.ctg11688.p1  ORF type:complete len:384 (+),score=46.23 Plantae.Rhodophyta-Hildenbrandia_rubra.ctg11688:1244-2395(+)